MASAKIKANARAKRQAEKKAAKRDAATSRNGAAQARVKAARGFAKAGLAASQGAQRRNAEAGAKQRAGKAAGALINSIATKGKVGKGALNRLAKSARLSGGGAGSSG